MVQRGLALLLTLAAVALGGCGGSASHRVLTPSATAQLNSELARVRTQADAGNRQGALAALAAFAAEVNRQKSAGQLSASIYAALQTGIARARAQIDVEVHPAPTVTTTPTVQQSTPAPAPAPPPHPGKGHGNPGKGHDHGGGGHKGGGGD